MDLQITDCEPSRGLCIELAMGWYGNQTIAQAGPNLQAVTMIEQAARYTAKHGLKPGDTSYVDPLIIPDLLRRAKLTQKLLLADIAAQLRSGKLYAVGLRVGEYTPVRIPREWWGVATLNPELNTADGNGVTFSGLLVFEAATDTIPKPDCLVSPTPSDKAAAWMKEHVTSYVAGQRDDRVAECRQALKITAEQAKAGWASLPEAIRGRSRQSR